VDIGIKEAVNLDILQVRAASHGQEMSPRRFSASQVREGKLMLGKVNLLALGSEHEKIPAAGSRLKRAKNAALQTTPLAPGCNSWPFRRT